MTENQQSPESSISVMLVDDDEHIRILISKYLKRQGYNVESFENAVACFAAFKKSPADIVITDLNMPGMNGMELLTAIKALDSSAEVVIISGQADKEVAIRALHHGAFDMFEKPLDLSKISATIRRTVLYQEAVRRSQKLGQQVELLASREEERWGLSSFVGKSKPIQDVLKQVEQLQKNDKISVLIRGESGTGKELIAHAIHYGSSRSGCPLVPVNCSAIPADLAESILFGHVKGSFTGASADKMGCFEAADGGSLFLDEIGDMSPDIQIKLLRVLEDETVTPVGANNGRKVDVRIIAATNADLLQKVKDGLFREDLYYRLARFTIHMPTLPERREDIPLLAEFFVRKMAEEMRIPVPDVDKSFIDALCEMQLSGNVRELRNIVERAMIVCSEEKLESKHLPVSDGSVAGDASSTYDVSEIPENLKEAEAWLIRRAIDKCNGNISEAARRLGITRAKIYRYK